MSVIQAVARPLIASIFVVGGFDAATKPEGKAAPVDKFIKQRLGDRASSLPPSPTLIRADGIAKVLAGTSLALGKAPRLSATVLAASLIPTTVVGHPYWDHDDPAAKAMHRTHLLKNAGLLGGLLLVAFGGRKKKSSD